MYDMTRQGDTNACWAACLSTLTGLPFDAFPQDEEAQCAVMQMTMTDKETGEKFPFWVPAIDQLVAEFPDPEGRPVPTIDDWAAALGPDLGLDVWTGWEPGFGEGVLMLMLYKDDGMADGHAVIIDEHGYLLDPAAGVIEGLHVSDIWKSCNTLVVGFAKVVEHV